MVNQTLEEALRELLIAMPAVGFALAVLLGQLIGLLIVLAELVYSLRREKRKGI